MAKPRPVELVTDHFGLVRWRRANQLSQRAISGALGLPQSAIVDFESGRRAVPLWLAWALAGLEAPLQAQQRYQARERKRQESRRAERGAAGKQRRRAGAAAQRADRDAELLARRRAFQAANPASARAAAIRAQQEARPEGRPLPGPEERQRIMGSVVPVAAQAPVAPRYVDRLDPPPPPLPLEVERERLLRKLELEQERRLRESSAERPFAPRELPHERRAREREEGEEIARRLTRDQQRYDPFGR